MMESGDPIRSFVAIELDDETRENLGAAQAELKKTNASVRWVRPQNVHLTISFLGDISAPTVTLVGEQLDIIGSRTRPLSFEITGLSAFGNRRFLRIVCACVAGNTAALTRLQADVNNAMSDLGLPVDDRPFKPHMTIGRIRSGHGLDDLKRILDTKRETHFGHVEVTCMALMKSVLAAQGPVYSTVHTSPFADTSLSVHA